MSGSTFLEVGFEYAPLSGCSELESYVCYRLVCTLVRSGAGVFAGAKPAALFSFDINACERCCASCRECRGVVDVANEALVSLAYALRTYGFGLVTFWNSDTRVMLLLYRDAAVAQVLEDGPQRDFLREHGYDISSAQALVGAFGQRLERYYAARAGMERSQVPASTFPHEIGVLFGYPLEDVEGFMHGAVPTCRGPWVAFGNPDEAHRNFDALLQAESDCRARFAKGATFGELTRSCAA